MSDEPPSPSPVEAGPSPAEEARLAGYARELADAIDRALPGWVLRCVRTRAEDAGIAFDAGLRARAEEAGEDARAELAPPTRRLLETDVDLQAGNPLALLRRGVRFPTEVLRDAGVPSVHRDEFTESRFPEDVYDLSPTNFDDVDGSLHEPGLLWGAAKAYVFLARRRAEGKR